jgi:hypothetical protein
MFKKRLWNWVFNYLSKPVNLEQIITVEKTGQILLDGKILTPSELIALQQEIRAFQNFRLKNVLLNTPKALAEIRMFRDSRTWDDMLAGKLTLYTVDLQEQIMLQILNAPQTNQVVIPKNPYSK